MGIKTIKEDYDRSWKHLEAKNMEGNAMRDVELAKRYRNMSINLYVAAFGIIFVILGTGGIIISLLV